jgi:hypothetical protein
MRRLLLLARQTSRWHRRWPHWAKDLYGLLSYVNFIELLPTILAIALAPRHFFRRLPQILAGKRRMYQTPIKFFVNFATLFLLVFYLRFGELRDILGQETALWYALLLIPLTPLLMPALGAATWTLYQAPRLLPGDKSFPQPNPFPFAMVLSPTSYVRLSPSRFLWGLFYMSIYFVAAWQLAQVAIGLNVIVTATAFASVGDGHLAVKAILILMSIVVLAGSVHLLVFRPYGELFRWSMRRPTAQAILCDLFPLRETVNTFFDNRDTTQTNSPEAAGGLGTEEFLLDAMCLELEAQIPAIRGLAMHQYSQQFVEQDWLLFDRLVAKSLRIEDVQAFLSGSADISPLLRARWQKLLANVASAGQPPSKSLRSAA